MIRKRLFLAGVLAVSLSATGCGDDGAGGGADADGVSKVRYVYCAETLAASGAPFWIGEKLGYFAEEKISLEMLPVSGGTGACLQLLAAGQADISAPSPDVLVQAAADGRNLDLRYFYEVAPKFLFDATVLPDSPVRSFADLKDATIGLASLGGSFELFAKAGLRAAGVDPASVDFVAVGTEAAAAESLKKGDIDALVINDVRYAALEAAGYQFRYLDKPGVTANLFGAGLLARNAWLTENPEAAAGYARAYTKSVLFAKANPEAAIRIHWEQYPQFAPTGDRAKAMQAALPVLKRRIDVIEDDGSAEKPYGQFTTESWQAYVQFLGVQDKVKDVSAFYTNDVAAKIGSIDAAAVRDKATSWPTS
ncbi:ABC transporter substrate-binding protein [Micromonospora wenchangensis]|uniref:ABC transporter substrate-binding protein n=1 Tax=Micromonospora wenchangensis TaxID=1185415 RepID=UPI003D707200